MKNVCLPLALFASAVALAAPSVPSAAPAGAPAPTAAPATSAPMSLSDVLKMIQSDADAYGTCKVGDEATYFTPQGKENLERFARHLHSLSIPKNPTFVGADGVGDVTTRATFYAYSGYRKSTGRMIAALTQAYAAWGVENLNALRRAKSFYSCSEMTALADQVKRFEKTYVTAKQYGPDIRQHKKVAGEKLWRTEDITFHDIWIGSGMSEYMNESLVLQPGSFSSRCGALDRWNDKLPPSRLQTIRETANNALKNVETLRKTLAQAGEKVSAAHLPPNTSSALDDLVSFDALVVLPALEKSYKTILELVDELEKDGSPAKDLRMGRGMKTVLADTDGVQSGELPSYRKAVKSACFRIESSMRHAYEETYGRKMPMK